MAQYLVPGGPYLSDGGSGDKSLPGFVYLSGGTSAPPSYTYLRPTSDVSNTGWTPSTGSDLYAMLDEETSNRADYISADAVGAVGVLGYTPIINEPTTGTDIEIRLDAQGMSEEEAIRIELLEGSTVRYDSGSLALGAAAEVTLTMTAAQWASVSSWPWTVRVRVTTL